MKKLFLLLLTFAVLSTNTQAQDFYTPKFAGATVTSNVKYGANYTVLTLSVTGHTTLQPLLCDVYTPTGDTTSTPRRPLVIYFPTGNFLGGAILKNPLGDKTDSCPTEICRRLAKLGYVAAAVNYRLGWNPYASTQTGKIAGLLQASYRGIQDARSAIRFFKANAATYNIDTTKIVLWGEGTGGYITLGASTLDNEAKISNTVQPAGKFLATIGYDSIKKVFLYAPVVNSKVDGDIYGLTATVSPGPTAYPLTAAPAGDGLCAPNSPANTSNFAMSVNMGGALGDISWLDKNSTPIVSVQCPNDRFAPYTSFVLQVNTPSGPQPVIEVQGAYLVQNKADSIGTNAPFSKVIDKYNPYKALSGPRSAGIAGAGNKNPTGLFGPLGGNDADTAPWQSWSLAQTYGKDSASLAGNVGMATEVTTPGAGKIRANLYIDSIMNFTLPRMCVVLNLPCKAVVTSTEDLLQASTTKLTIAPNPSFSAISFSSEVFNPMHAIELYDLSGRQVVQINNINSAYYNLQRNGLTSGMYIAKVKFEGGILTKKVLFQD